VSDEKCRYLVSARLVRGRDLLENDKAFQNGEPDYASLKKESKHEIEHFGGLDGLHTVHAFSLLRPKLVRSLKNYCVSAGYDKTSTMIMHMQTIDKIQEKQQKKV